MNKSGFIVEEWAATHPRWAELSAAIGAQGQADWAFNPFFGTFPRHFLAALSADQVVGFLMFVVWEIGPHDRNCPPLFLDGVALTEAKVIAFGVHEAYRRQGIGRALQQHAIERARELGCYQVRSVSGENYSENHRLKLSMGFGVEPMERDQPSLAFVLPLR